MRIFLLIALFICSFVQAQIIAPLNPNSNDNSLALQTICDSIIQHPGATSTYLYVKNGRYRFQHPIILQRFLNGVYFPFTVQIVGNGTYSSADGYGTIFDFSACKDNFGFGIQGGKGVSISGITMVGAWVYNFTTPYNFYNFPLGNGVCRNSSYSPNYAFVIDPFGPQVPPDGGYPGTDAYGNPLTMYYRGGINGSTGVTIHNIKFQGWLGALITSPNGRTRNAELCHFYNLQFFNVRYGIAGCQDQEKMNEVDHVEAWGVTEFCFVTGMYGAASPGNWSLHHWNIAGYVQQFAYNQQSGYYPSYFDNIYAETLGSLGTITSFNGTSFTNSSINFANYIDASHSYTFGQIQGSGVTYRDCQFRMYGTYNPITINNLNGYNVFDGCSFDQTPYFNSDYPYNKIKFNNCSIAGAYLDDPWAHEVAIDSTAPGFAPTYVLTIDSIARTTQVKAVGNEMQRVKVGSIIVGRDNLAHPQGVLGIVTTIQSDGFMVSYVPQKYISGKNYYLSLWIQGR